MKNVNQATLVMVALATVRDASVTRVGRQAVYVMTSLGNVIVNLESPVNYVLFARFVFQSTHLKYRLTIIKRSIKF